MPLSRRRFVSGSLLSATGLALSACATTGRSGSEIDKRVLASRELMFNTVPGTRDLAAQASGLLIIPEIIEGGFIISGAYGEGALLVGDAIVDYVSMAAAAFGLQIGGQSYAQALFLLTPEALASFRQADGWELGVDAEFAVLDTGVAAGSNTSTINKPVYQVVYGQRGLLLGVTIEGAKYNRIIR